MYLSDIEQDIMRKSTRLDQGGIDLFWMYWSAPEGATQEEARMDLVGKAPDLYIPELQPHQFVPIKPIYWAKDIVHGDESDWCIIGGVGCSPLFTKIYDAEAMQYVPLQHYVDTNTRPVVLSYTGGGWAKVVATVPFYVGNGPVYKLTTESGNTIYGSSEHKLLTSIGYTRLPDIKPGELVVAPSDLNIPNRWRSVLATPPIDYEPTRINSVNDGVAVFSYTIKRDAVYYEPDTPYLVSNNTTSYVVEAIECVGNMDYYDIHVPIYNNYVAEGMVNHNSGKTLNMDLIALYYACMLPNFRYLGTAPLAWQADMAYKEIVSFILDVENPRPRRINRWIKSIKQRPYPTVTLVNGSTLEFHSLDKDAKNVLTWTGDMAVVDQAEDPDIDLEAIMGNLGSRLRGMVNGRARLGKMILMANSAYNEVLWETFDRYETTKGMGALLLTSYDNPYLTQKQLQDIARRYRNADEERRMMHSERPLPKGKEFTENRILRAIDEGLDKLINDCVAERREGYELEDAAKAGIVKWWLKPQMGHTYITAGDPGQGNPPFRNSGVVMTFDITDFPSKPATLACFTWVFGYGSYHPFINELERQYAMYKPEMAAFDATGTQKSFDDLGVLDQTMLWTPLNMAGQKMHFVVCLKVLMDRSLIKMPKQVKSIWNQLLMWCMPDKDLNQDIASTLFMVGYMLNQFLPVRVEEDNDGIEMPEDAAQLRNSSLRNGQSVSMRNTL